MDLLQETKNEVLNALKQLANGAEHLISDVHVTDTNKIKQYNEELNYYNKLTEETLSGNSPQPNHP